METDYNTNCSNALRGRSLGDQILKNISVMIATQPEPGILFVESEQTLLRRKISNETRLPESCIINPYYAGINRVVYRVLVSDVAKYRACLYGAVGILNYEMHVCTTLIDYQP